jgi:ferritin-like metal-binding protein YciE
MVVTTVHAAELNIEQVEKLLCDEIADLLHVENMHLKALPKLVAGAFAPELKGLFTKHIEDTRRQVKRLEKMFATLNLPAREKKCEAMMGLLVECQHLLTRAKPSPVFDQALLCATRKVESFEIVAYQSVAAWAGLCGNKTIRTLALETVEEEQQMIRALEKMVVSGKGER